MKEKLIYNLENLSDWDKFFGVADSIFSDKGFKSSSDNFIKSKILETAFGISTNMERVDEKGWDFTFQDIKIELKTCTTLLKKRKNNRTAFLKMKSFRGEIERASVRFKEEKCFDYLVCIGIKDRSVIIIDDEVARSKYKLHDDKLYGMFAVFEPNDYYQCKINSISPYEYNKSISDLIDENVRTWIGCGEPPNTLMKYF